METERIVITFNPDGSWRGASTTDFGGVPIPLDALRLAALAPDLNAALLSSVESLTARLEQASEVPMVHSPDLSPTPPPIPEPIAQISN